MTAIPNQHQIILVDDHPVVRHGLTQFINLDPTLHVCYQTASESEALDAVDRLKPDTVITDLSLSDGNGLELLRKLRHRHPNLPLLVLSAHDESLHAERALRCGASGYVMKQESLETVLAALKKILRNEIYLSDRMASRLLGKLTHAHRQPLVDAPLGELSDREFQIFEMIGLGQPPRDIARKLGLSVKTIDAHRERIKEKLRLKSANELVRYAVTSSLAGLSARHTT